MRLGGRRAIRSFAGAATALALSVAPASAATTTRPTCAKLPAVCTLKGASAKSGIRVGAAMDATFSPTDTADALAHFNALTSENAFKWSEMESTQGTMNWAATDATVNWANANKMRLRAHTLFWHRMQTPAWVRQSVEASSTPTTTLRNLIRARVASVVGHYKGRVAIWDVVNEPTALFGKGWDLADGPLTPKNFFYTTLGETYIDDAFKAARAADPKAKLFLNEIVWNPEIGDAKADALLALVKRLKARKVPIDGVGLQLHAMLGVKEPWFPANSTKLLAYMNALGKAGVKVEITEMDVSLPKVIEAAGKPTPSDSAALALQASVFGGAAGACARSSACTGVTVWGLRDSDTWLDSYSLTSPLAPNRPLLLDELGATKPAYRAVRDALLFRCPATGRQPATCSKSWP